MPRTFLLALGCLLLGASTGCTVINSAQPTTPTVTGEVWYTKTTHLLWAIPLGSDIYYCPADKPTECQLAVIKE